MNLIDDSIAKVTRKKIPLVEKLRAMNTMNQFTVDIPIYRAKGKGTIPLDRRRGVYLIDVPYDSDTGIGFGTDFRNIL